jgi:uncharacterized spore protein YtfJ
MAVCSELIADMRRLWGDKFKPELVVVLSDVDSVYGLVVEVGGCSEVPIEQLGLGCSWGAGEGDVNEAV